MSGSKLKSLATRKSSEQNDSNCELNFMEGFKEAFKMIDENLARELKKIEEYPAMGERIMTLKIYKNKIKEILKEMELNYE